MKKTTIEIGLFGIFFLMLFLIPYSQNVKSSSSVLGAWALSASSAPDYSEEVKGMALFAKSYVTYGVYSEDSDFIGAGCGSYTLEDNQLTIHWYVHLVDSTLEGKDEVYKVNWANDDKQMILTKVNGTNANQTWTNIDQAEQPLAGAWQITARMNKEGEMREMKPRPRKTIKMLTGSRFQWIAINTETNEFFGTGGGIYTFENGKYTEKIEFFSRDASRVGMSLTFDGKIDGDDWTHSGKSSKGDPIKEVWTRQP